jgi:REP element-mobilizing transposase RayT
MNRYNPVTHHRRSIRLKGYDYAQEGLYFITLCCQDRLHLFGNITNSIMCINPIGAIVETEWLNTANIRDNIVLHEHIIMPNHLHGIIEITKNKTIKEDNKGFSSPTQTIGSIIRGYKIATIKQIKDYIKDTSKDDRKGELQFAPTALTIINLDYRIWQRNYYEHIIKDEKAYHNISNYIIHNPSKWEDDTFKN